MPSLKRDLAGRRRRRRRRKALELPCARGCGRSLRHICDRLPHVCRACTAFPQDLREALHLRLERAHAVQVRRTTDGTHERRRVGRRGRVGLFANDLVRVPVARLAVARACGGNQISGRPAPSVPSLRLLDGV